MPERGPPARPDRVLFVFLDGVGLAEDDPVRNPMTMAEIPTIRSLLSDAGRQDVSGPSAWTAADARLGVAGLPQSGTGQTSLLTGINAVRQLGRHFGPWVPTALRETLARESLFRRARRADLAVAFANATPPSQLGAQGGTWRRPAAPPLAASTAGVFLRSASELRAGRAVASSITNERWREHLDDDLPEISPAEAGALLTEIAREADLTIFAHYDTDFAGHRGSRAGAVAALERVDAFLAGVIAARPVGMLLVVASDHGNIEDLTTGHTLNPVPVIAVGPGAPQMIARVRDIADVAGGVLRALGVVDP